MHHSTTHGICVISLLSFACAWSYPALAQNNGNLTAQKSAAPSGSITLIKHALKDPGTNNIDSHTLLAPKGWNVTGSAWWGGANLYNIFPSQDVKISSPGGVEVHIGPSMALYDYIPSPQGAQYGGQRPQEWTAQNGVLVLYLPSDLDGWQSLFQNQLLPKTYPDATEIKVQMPVIVPELTQVMQQQLAPMRDQANQMNQQNQQMGVQMFSMVDGAFLAVNSTYTIHNQKWEQLNILGVAYYVTDLPTGRTINWGVEPTVAFRAHKGELEKNMPLLMAVANSIRPTQQWAAMKADHIAKMNQIAAKGAADRSRIIADSNREISRIINEGYEQRQASMDRTHHQFVNAIREVDDFVTTSGVGGHGTDPVQLPSYYDHIYTNGDQYILTNDANYNPNADPR
ncbi:MAG: hypothetical protein HC801_07460 [Nitrospira sp.]|nr:hypothetical protein [Nitrospira sp.]